MTTEEDPMLKIVLCEEEDLADRPMDEQSKRYDKLGVQSQSSRMMTVRKQNGVRSANFALASNPYQRKGNCANCQYMQNAKNNVSSFTQKIMSAKLLRFKQMQNQISEMSLKMNELMSENKVLKTLQRRQDHALKKYEGSKEQLPQLIKNHNEEVRVINQRFKQLKAVHRDLENKLKQKDTELTNLREQHSHLLQLSRDKQLVERDKLTKKLAALEMYSKEQSEKIVVLLRKLELQEKNFNHQLHLEIQKHRETQTQLLNIRQLNNARPKEGQEKASSPRKIMSNNDTYGNRSRASLPSPARHVVIDGQRTTMSDRANKISSSLRVNTKDLNEESDSAPEEQTNIKVSFRKSNLVKQNPVRNRQSSAKGSLSNEDSAQKTVEDPEDKSDGSWIPGGVSMTSNLSEDVPKPPNTVIGEIAGRHFMDSPKLAHHRAGISIPSDLAIGNAVRVRATAAIPSTEESVSSDDEAFLQLERRTTESPESGEDNSDSKATKNTLRARTEEDIDQIISRACKDVLPNEPDFIVNSLENFSLSKDLSQLKDLSWEELPKQIKPMRDETAESKGNSDYLLDPNEKNHLLKALNLIDEENKPAEGSLEPTYFPIEREERQSVRQMFAQNRKKVDLMESVFGLDRDPIPMPRAINGPWQ